MSSMVRITLLAALAATATTALSAPCLAQADPGRAGLVAQSYAGQMSYAVSRWEQLAASPNYTFEDYSSFLLSYPGFPDEDKLRRQAEERLTQEFVATDRLLAFFDRYPPLTNNGRAQQAIAMMALRPDQAEAAARAAWRGGTMGENAFATLFATYGGRFTPDDHDARMDALLWQRDATSAARQLAYVSPARAQVFAARL